MSYSRYQSEAQSGRKPAGYIDANDMLLSSSQFPGNLFVREVQTRLVIGRIGPHPGQLLSSRRELIRRTETPIGVP